MSLNRTELRPNADAWGRSDTVAREYSIQSRPRRLCTATEFRQLQQHRSVTFVRFTGVREVGGLGFRLNFNSRQRRHHEVFRR